MAEVKNSFTSSKMNQDLDDRLVPSNEYREGRNISIISSDSSNTGAIENILGNIKISDLSTGFSNAETIGYTFDQTTNKLYLMLTNYTDTSPNQLDIQLCDVATIANQLNAKIVQVDLNNTTTTNYIILAQGYFLNFSTTHPITGINIIENLLFWTDNRNQPRKINIDSAISGATSGIPYYINEDQISVAKYAPIDVIQFLDEYGNSSMKDVVSQYLPDGTTANPYYNPNYTVDPAYIKGKFIRFSYRFRFDDGEYSILAPFSQIAFIPEQDGSFITSSGNSDEDNAYRSSIVSFMKNKVNEIGLMIPLPSTGSNLFTLFKITEIDILYKESDSITVQVLDTVLPGATDSTGFRYVPNELAKVAAFGTGWTIKIPTTGTLNNGGYSHSSGSGVSTLTTTVATTGDWAMGSLIVEAGSIAIPYINIGDVVSGTGIAVGAVVVSIDEGNLITLSLPNTASGSTTDVFFNTPVSINTVYQVSWTISNRTTGTVSITYGGTSVVAGTSTSGRAVITTTNANGIIITPTSVFNGTIIISIIEKNNYILNNNSFFNYTYQSRKPKTTLNPDQITRVYDKVPVRALAQESSGGRVIYGNYIDKHTPPLTLDYNIRLSAKETNTTTEYPLHTVKQNRNYQVGIILSDRYGRQSDVILSTVNDGSISGILPFNNSSTFYAPYLADGTDVLAFFGNSIKILFNSVIKSERSPLNTLGIPATGEPGLYDGGGKLDSLIIVSSLLEEWAAGAGQFFNQFVYDSSGTDTGIRVTTLVTYNAAFDEYSLGSITITNTNNVVLPEDTLLYLAPAYIGAALEVGPLTPASNPLGWYSYKVVVKQTEQEYYNVYLPGILNAYPEEGTATFPTGETDKTSHTVLFSDNINKVPRDLSEVGPDQKQYRSSVRLFGRVQNTYISSVTNNAQFFPTSIGGFSISTLGNANDLGMTSTALTALGEGNLYQFSTNPIVGRISTNGQAFGVISANMVPYLAIAETDPVTSSLDIYWETSTTGLISDLNTAISESNPGAVGFVNVNYKQFENQNPNLTGTATGAVDSKWVTNWFYPVNYTGAVLTDTTITDFEVVNGNRTSVLSSFGYERELQEGIYKYRIKIINVQGFNYNSNVNSNLFIFTLSVKDSAGIINQLQINGNLGNIVPQVNTYVLNPIYTGTTTITSSATGENGSWYSGTKTLGLKWSFEDGTLTKNFSSGSTLFTLNINSTTGILTKPSGNSRTLESFNILLTDSGGLNVLYPLTLDFRPGEFDPTEFNLDFNL